MKNYFKLLLIVLFVLPVSVLKASETGTKDPIEGRWDLTVNMDGRMAPSWLEVRHTGVNGYFGRFVEVRVPFQKWNLKMANCLFIFRHNGKEQIKNC
jgi:hypothetical protein